MAEEQQQVDGHQQMAARVHSIFAQGQGVQVSSAQAEAVVEIKLWLAAIANGQLKVIDTAPQAGPEGMSIPTGPLDGTPPN